MFAIVNMMRITGAVISKKSKGAEQTAISKSLKTLLTLSLPSSQKVHSPNLLKRKCRSEVVRIGSAIIFHLSEL